MSNEKDNDSTGQLVELLTTVLQNQQQQSGDNNGFKRPKNPYSEGEYPRMETPPLVGVRGGYFTPHNLVTMVASIIVTTVFVITAWSSTQNDLSNVNKDVVRIEQEQKQKIERAETQAKQYTDTQLNLYKAEIGLKFQSINLEAQGLSTQMGTILAEVKAMRKEISEDVKERDKKWDEFDDRLGELERSVESVWREARKKTSSTSTSND